MFAVKIMHHLRCSALIPLECRYRFLPCELSQVPNKIWFLYQHLHGCCVSPGCRVIAKDHNLEGRSSKPKGGKSKKTRKGSGNKGSGKSGPSSSKGLKPKGSRKSKGSPSKKGQVPRKSKNSQPANIADDQPGAPATSVRRKKSRKA